MNGYSWQRLLSIGSKEALHVARDPQTLFFTLFIPLLELFLLGFAIDTNVRFVPTVVVDLAGTQESGALVRRFENSQDLRVVARAHSEAHSAVRTAAPSAAHCPLPQTGECASNCSARRTNPWLRPPAALRRVQPSSQRVPSRASRCLWNRCPDDAGNREQGLEWNFLDNPQDSRTAQESQYGQGDQGFCRFSPQ